MVEAGPLCVFAQGPPVIPPTSEVHISFQVFGAEIWSQCHNLNRNFCGTLHSPTPLCLMRSLAEMGSFCPRFEKLLCFHFGIGLEKNLGPVVALDFKCL